MKIGEAMYQAQAPEGGPPEGGPQGGAAPGGSAGTATDEKVVDAEFEEVDDKKKKSA